MTMHHLTTGPSRIVTWGPKPGLPSWLECHAQGMTADQARLARGCDISSARQWARKNGLKWAGAHDEVLAAREAKWEKCCADGMTSTEAAAALGVSRKAANVWAFRRGKQWAPARGKYNNRSVDPAGIVDQPYDEAADVDAAKKCLRLWRCVMHEKLRDALNGTTPGQHSAYSASARDVRRARAWFGSDDFYAVCLLIDFDPVRVLKFYHAALKNGDHLKNGELIEMPKARVKRRLTAVQKVQPKTGI